MPQQSILDFIASQGLGWFLAIVLLVPVSMLLVVLAVVVIAKKYLGFDFKTLAAQRERESAQREMEIKGVHELSSEMRLLREHLNLQREQIKQQEEAMWGSRDHTDRQLRQVYQHFDAHHAEIKAQLDKLEDQHQKIILYLVKVCKKRTEAVHGHSTEVFLNDDHRRPS